MSIFTHGLSKIRILRIFDIVVLLCKTTAKAWIQRHPCRHWGAGKSLLESPESFI